MATFWPDLKLSCASFQRSLTKRIKRHKKKKARSGRNAKEKQFKAIRSMDVEIDVWWKMEEKLGDTWGWVERRR